MEYKYFKIFTVLENGSDFDFVLPGMDESSIGITVSKMRNIYKIKNIRLAKEDEIPRDE
jgi:hypothetical protein